MQYRAFNWAKLSYRITALFLTGLGLFGFAVALLGATTGKIPAYSKTGGSISAAEIPLFFWLMIPVWICTGIYLLRLAGMFWQFGSESETLRYIGGAYSEIRRSENRAGLILLAIYTVFALFVYGGYEDFVPAKGWNYAGTLISVVLTSIIAMLIASKSAAGQIRLHEQTSILKKCFAYLFLVLVSYLFLSIAIIHGLGAAFTSIIGNPFSLEVVAAKEFEKNSRSCVHRLRASELKFAFPSYICISETKYVDLPLKEKITLNGSKSLLGFSVSSWRVKNANKPLQPTTSGGG